MQWPGKHGFGAGVQSYISTLADKILLAVSVHTVSCGRGERAPGQFRMERPQHCAARPEVAAVWAMRSISVASVLHAVHRRPAMKLSAHWRATDGEGPRLTSPCQSRPHYSCS